MSTVSGLMLERERELAQIDAALAGPAGSAQPVLVEGPAGVGKTRLLNVACERARAHGMVVAQARGSELERHSSFGLVRALFEPPLRALDPAAQQRLGTGAAGPVMGLLLGTGAAPAVAKEELSFVIGHAVFWLAVGLAERGGLLVCADDLQWADPASLGALAFVVGRADELDGAVVLALRTGEPDEPAALGALRDDARMRVLRPSPLTEQGSAQVMHDTLGAATSEGFSAACHRATGGNPFLLGALARDVAEQGLAADDAAAQRIGDLAPDAVVRTTTARVRRLGEGSVALARAVAVLERADPALAAQLAGLGADESATAIHALTSAGLLAEELPLRFDHPLHRAAVYAELTPAELEHEHHRAAQALTDPTAAAAHLLRTSPRGEEWAADALHAAGRGALAEGATEEAGRLLGRAVAERPEQAASAELLLALARAEGASGNPAALERLQTALGRADGPVVRSAVLAALGGIGFLRGDVDHGLRTSRRALDELSQGEDDASEASLLLSYTIAARIWPDHVAEVKELLAQPRSGPLAEQARTALRALDGLLSGRPSAEVEELARTALSHATPDDSEVPVHGVMAIQLGAFVLAGLDDFRTVLPLADRALAEARRRGSILEYASMSEGRAWCRRRQGLVPQTMADADAVIAVAGPLSSPHGVTSQALRAELLLELGDLEGAAAAVDISPELEARLPGVWGHFWLPLARSSVARALGDRVRALEQALLCGERLIDVGAPSPVYCPWRSRAALAAEALGDLDHARSLVGEELDLARAIGSPRATGIALRTSGLIEGGEEGLALLGESVECFAGTQILLERGRSLVELGGALRRGGHRRDSREPLRQGLELALRCGATALAARAHDELGASGVHSRPQQAQGVGALTPRELRVTELAVEGLTNPEIAQTLLVSPRTIESHLTNVYRKLRVTGRDELAGALGSADAG